VLFNLKNHWFSMARKLIQN